MQSQLILALLASLALAAPVLPRLDESDVLGTNTGVPESLALLLREKKKYIDADGAEGDDDGAAMLPVLNLTEKRAPEADETDDDDSAAGIAVLNLERHEAGKKRNISGFPRLESFSKRRKWPKQIGQ